MVMKAFTKSTYRMLKKHISRMISIIIIVLLSVSFVSGVGAVKDKIYRSTISYYKSQNIPDFIIKSTSLTGFTNQQINLLKENFTDEIIDFTSYDKEIDREITRFYFFDFDKLSINKLELLEGRYPTESNECMVERETESILKYNIGVCI